MSKKKFTTEEIYSMSFQQMIKVCPDAAIKCTYQKKDGLIGLLKAAIENGTPPLKEKEQSTDVKDQCSEEVIEILEHLMLNKNDKM